MAAETGETKKTWRKCKFYLKNTKICDFKTLKTNLLPVKKYALSYFQAPGKGLEKIAKIGIILRGYICRTKTYSKIMAQKKQKNVLQMFFNQIWQTSGQLETDQIRSQKMTINAKNCTILGSRSPKNDFLTFK